MAQATQYFIPQRHRGKALGLMSSGTAYGVFANSVIIQAFFEADGWRSIWLFTAILSAVLCGIAVALFHHGASNAKDMTSTQPLRSSVRELAAPLPLLLLAIMFLNGLACIPFQTYLSSYLVEDHNHTITSASDVWRIIGVVGMFSGFLMGWVGDRITIRWALGLAVRLAIMSGRQ